MKIFRPRAVALVCLALGFVFSMTILVVPPEIRPSLILFAISTLMAFAAWSRQDERKRRDAEWKIERRLLESISQIGRKLRESSKDAELMSEIRSVTRSVGVVARFAKTTAEAQEIRLQRIEQLIENYGGASPQAGISQRQWVASRKDPDLVFGREAATVRPDASRARRLHGAVSSSDPWGTSVRDIGIIGTRLLSDHLYQRRYGLLELLTSQCIVQYQTRKPQALVIEEAALDDGIWAGSIEAHGTLLFDEVLRLMSVAREDDTPVYVIANAVSSTNSTLLHSTGTLVVYPDEVSVLPDYGETDGLLAILQQYCKATASSSLEYDKETNEE